jgi:formyl-CoA transferase
LNDKVSPLEGVKVLELGTLIAGPYCASILAQFGAEVIKVESPNGGDPLRAWRKLHNNTSLWWYSQSRNKKSLTLDLKAAEGQDIIRKLVKSTDILIENFRPGTLEKWGLGWEQLVELNPRLIMVRVSGYGQTGPYSDRPGFAAVAESMGGLRYVAGYPDRPPVRVGISIGDTLASLYGVIGAMMAMHHLNVNKGKGQYIDVAIYESVFGVMESLIPEYSAQGFIRERTGSSMPGITPSNTYQCKDGGYIIIAGNSDSIFKRLMHAIGRIDLAENVELEKNEGRARNAELIDGAIQSWCDQFDLSSALSVLESADVPCGPIYTAADIDQDPHYEARGMLEKHPLPDGTWVKFPGIVPKLSETPGKTKWLGPELGADNRVILKDLGLTDDRIDDLIRRRVL